MAFGHDVRRGGFESKDKADDLVGNSIWHGSSGDNQIKGNNGNNAINGGGGDDVIIGKGGDDHLAGGNGEDDISGGAGNDLMTGAIWDDSTFYSSDYSSGDPFAFDSQDNFRQDDFSDDFNAEASYEENGEDTIWFYDDDPTDFEGSGVVDKIDFSDAIDLDPSNPEADELEDFIVYNTATGQVQSADNDDEDWFTIYTNDGRSPANTVYVEVDGTCYVWNNADDGAWDVVA